MFGEAHAHMLMNGVDYAQAVACHADGPNDAVIRQQLESYRQVGIDFVRDGGDALGVSHRAAQLAPEYGIDYRTPL